MPKKVFFFLEQQLSGRFFHAACKPRLPLGGRIAALGLGLTLGQVFSLLVLKPSRIGWCWLAPLCASLSRGCWAKRRTWQNLPPLLQIEPWAQKSSLPSNDPGRLKPLGRLTQHHPCCHPIPIPQTPPATLPTAGMPCPAALGGLASLLAKSPERGHGPLASRRREKPRVAADRLRLPPRRAPRTRAPTQAARACAPAARDADKAAIEICYIYLQPSPLLACWHDREPEALQALAGLRSVRDWGVEEPVSAGSGSGSCGVGHKGQKVGFPCLVSQRGHCPHGPAPDPGEGWVLAGVSWPISHLPLLQGEPGSTRRAG